MFQSLWNVAAAFCTHEEPFQAQQSYHFGHHQNTLCSQEHIQQCSDEQLTTTDNDFNTGEDHQDHLPSMMHLYLQNTKVAVISPSLKVTVTPQFHWVNSYQAPDLFQQSPPPERSPLKVG